MGEVMGEGADVPGWLKTEGGREMKVDVRSVEI
jgi:hypothetical protein